MKRTALLIIATFVTASMALATSLNIGVEAGYDFFDFRWQDNVYHTVSPNGTNLGIIKYYDEFTQAGKYVSTYSATTLKGIPLQKTVTETKNNVGRMPSMHGFHVGPTFDLRFSDKMGLGLRFGLNYQYARTNGGIFDSKDDRNLHNNGDYYKRYNTTYHGLSIPIRLSYTWDLPKNWNIWVMTGPKINIELSFKENYSELDQLTGKWNDYTYDYISGKQYINGTLVEWEDPSDLAPKLKEEYYKTWPVHLTWGIGFGFGYKNFSFSVLYDFGITNRYYKSSETYQHAINLYDNPETGIVIPWPSVETYEYKHSMYSNELTVSVAYTFPVIKKSIKMTGSHKGEYTNRALKSQAKQEAEVKEIIEQYCK